MCLSVENDNKYSIFKNRHRDVVRFSNLASSNAVGIGLTETPNSGWAKAHPVHLLTASLQNVQINELPMTLLMIAFLLHPNQKYYSLIKAFLRKKQTISRQISARVLEEARAPVVTAH